MPESRVQCARVYSELRLTVLNRRGLLQAGDIRIMGALYLYNAAHHILLHKLHIAAEEGAGCT
jgi:hypothetical protein